MLALVRWKRRAPERSPPPVLPDANQQAQAQDAMACGAAATLLGTRPAPPASTSQFFSMPRTTQAAAQQLLLALGKAIKPTPAGQPRRLTASQTCRFCWFAIKAAVLASVRRGGSCKRRAGPYLVSAGCRIPESHT